MKIASSIVRPGTGQVKKRRTLPFYWAVSSKKLGFSKQGSGFLFCSHCRITRTLPSYFLHMSPAPKSKCWALTLHQTMVIFGDSDFQEGGIKIRPLGWQGPFTCKPRRKDSSEPEHTDTLILDIQPPELPDNTFLRPSSPRLCVVFHYGIPRKPTQRLWKEWWSFSKVAKSVKDLGATLPLICALSVFNCHTAQSNY